MASCPHGRRPSPEAYDERGIIPVIPNNASRSIKRKTDFVLYRERNLSP